MSNHIFVSTGYSGKFRFVKLVREYRVLLLDIIGFPLKKSLLMMFFNTVIMSYVKRKSSL